MKDGWGAGGYSTITSRADVIVTLVFFVFMFVSICGLVYALSLRPSNTNIQCEPRVMTENSPRILVGQTERHIVCNDGFDVIEMDGCIYCVERSTGIKY